jgi:hypothetical protein
MHRTTQVVFQALIDALGLTIHLRMVHHGVTQLSAHRFKQLLPEVARENFISIGHDREWHTM